jgi:hypothetical protein
MEHVCAFLIQSGLPKLLWAEAVHFVIWLKNRTTTWVLSDTTPHEQLTGQKPNVAGVPEWGQCVWVHTTFGTKLGRHAKMAHWIGYNRGSTHAHRIYWPEMQTVTTERNIRFTTEFTTVLTSL